MSFFYVYFPYLIVLVLGLTMGSFLNVLADRIPKNEKITGRSHCDNCKLELKWLDLVPLISFISTSGKCRYCSAPYSIVYPLSELLTALLFVYTYIFLNIQIYDQFSLLIWIELTFYLFVVSCLVVIFFSDLKYKIIPDKILVPLVSISFLYQLLIHNSNLITHLFSGIGALLFFLFIYILTKRKGMGFGDVKFAFFMGVLLGFPGVFYAIYLSFLTGGFFGLILILWRKKKLKSEIAFGPFLIIGTLLSLFFKPEIEKIINLVLH